MGCNVIQCTENKDIRPILNQGMPCVDAEMACHSGPLGVLNLRKAALMRPF